MARITALFAAINDVAGPIGEPTEESQYASVFVGPGAGTLVLEISGQDDGATPPVDQWVAVQITLPVAAATVEQANIVAGAGSQYGYALVPGAHKVRLRETATGAVRATLSLSCL